MPASTKTPISVVDTMPYWVFHSPTGPRSLYLAFAQEAIDRLVPDFVRTLSEDDYGRLLDVVYIAVTTALTAAGVSDSWEDAFQQAIAGLEPIAV